MRIGYCIITCRRPEGLRKLLLGLDRDAEALHEEDLIAVVIDNDSDGSARVVVDEVPLRNLRCRYHIEHEPGIPFARNRSVQEALALECELLVFVDDDEYPPPGESWMSVHLDRLRSRPDVAVSVGPVRSRFPDGTPRWIRRSSVFIRTKREDGSPCDRCATNNTVVRATLFSDPNLRFDGAMRHTGGSDTDLFYRAYRAGHGIVWTQDAVICEDVPAARCRVGWIARRHFRLGANVTRFLFKYQGHTVLGALRRGLMRMVFSLLLGATLLPVLPWFRDPFLRYFFRGLGRCAGAFGVSVDEYGSRHLERSPEAGSSCDREGTCGPSDVGQPWRSADGTADHKDVSER